MKNHIKNMGIDIYLTSRIVDVEKEEARIKGIYISDRTYVEGDVFIETTGSTVPMGNCIRYGNGCSMCVLRSPAFGPNESLSTICSKRICRKYRNSRYWPCKIDDFLLSFRKIKELESVKYIDPYAGEKGNSIRYLSVAPRTDDMKVKGLDNLFVGGEKSGLFVSHTDA